MNEIRNFDQSLLYYVVNNSQMNPSHFNNDKKITTNLFNDLNMTYSRLTTQSSYENVNSQPQCFFINYLTQNQQIDQSMEIQEVQRCANCKKMKKQLKKVELFLQEIESKFIQKELKLIEKFTEISLQVKKAKQQSQKYKSLYFKTSKQLNTLKHLSKPPKIDMLNKQTHRRQKTQLYEKPIQNLSTVQSTIGAQTKRLTCFIPKEFKIMNQNKQNSLFDSIAESTQQKFSRKSDSSTIQLQYTESEAEPYFQVAETKKFNAVDLNKKIFSKQISLKNKNKSQTLLLKDLQKQDFRLKFQNDNLKNYNNVLLEHSKPKRLASKIFNLKQI